MNRRKSSRKPRSNTGIILILSLVFILAFSSVRAQEPETTVTPDGSSSFAIEPTDEPTDLPPTPAPTDVPTEEVTTPAPTDVPTEEVTTPAPTDVPTEVATEVATEQPTDVPTDTVTPNAPEVTEVTSTPTEPTATIVLPGKSKTPVKGIASSSCQMDINDSGDSDPYTFSFAAINATGIASYSWDFGDSTSASTASVNHTYTAPGTYNITLTCVPTSGANLVLNGSISITNPVVASFALSPSTTGYAPFTINLVNTSTGSGLSFLWEVTGPETYSATTENANFTLSTPGSYNVKLTVTDSGGQSAFAQYGVVVSVPAPLADFTLNPATGAPPMLVTVQGFMQPGSGPIDTWTWDFGDGSPTVVDTVASSHTHNYPLEGNYNITLTYVGPSGNGMIMRQVAVYNAGVTVTADFNYTLVGNSGGGMQVCFDNTSSGPVVTNTWDFGDGSPAVLDNSAQVCHIYTSENNFQVILKVVGSDVNVTSTAKRTISVVFAPVASFNASSTNIDAGDAVSFTDTSTGFITDWAWDFNNDGTTDSTQQNPSNIPFSTIGGNTVRLTVTGPGGSSTAEMLIIVSRAEITCDFNGNLVPTPGSTIAYDGIINNLRGRGITYSWTITGPANSTYTTEDISVNWGTAGSYLVTFSATTDDGSSCAKTKSVQVTWPDLVCSISGTFNPSPNGSSYTYSANVSNLVGRTAQYVWTIDGATQPETGNSLSRSWTVPTTQTIAVHITTTDGSGDCGDTQTLNVQWPALTCSVSGDFTPLPQLPDDATRSTTYTAVLGGLDIRSVTYQWIVDGVVQASTGPTLTLSWAWNETGPYSVQLNVVADNNDATTTPCSTSNTINVTVPAMYCATPFGDTTPVLNETVTYTRNVGNQFDRTVTADSWELQQYDDVNAVWFTVATGTGDTITYTFNLSDTQYRIQYSISVTMPDESCTSAWEIINAAGAGVDFICEFGPNGNLSPASASSNYVYTISVDNTNAIPLDFTWVQIDSSGGERILATNTSTIDGIVSSPAISGAAMGPADNYTLRVDVASVASPYKCSLSAALVVGTLTVNYTFNVNNNAVPVGQDICLTNVSTTSHGDINSMTYAWDFGSASNSLGIQTSTAQQPGCLNFPNPGTYVITLTGTNASGNRSATVSYTFHVYGLQSIAINHSNQSIAPASMSFSAVSVNLSAPYSWTFRNVTTNTIVGTRTGQNVTFPFGTAGTYEAIVSASGPLGTNTATAQFTLLAVDDIRAAFTPSTYNGAAPLYVCFTDRSVGNNIISWKWDFDNDGVIDSTVQNPCTTFSTPSQAYPIHLTIQNSSSKTATASNIIHTFNALEAHSTFTIIPQGNGLYCFQSLIDGTTTVTSWDFGDGTTISTGNLNYVCHQYSASGSYVVTMNITDPPTTGVIKRPVDVDLSPTPSTPSLVVNGSCSLAGGAVFTVRNTGGDMTTPDSLKITDANGVVVVVDDTLKLASGASKTYNVTNSYGTLTLTTVDTHVNVTTYCNHPPVLTGSAVCQPDGSVQFIINNSSTDSDANQSYTVVDGGGATVKTGTVTASKNGGSQTIAVPGYYPSLTLNTSGTPASTTTLALTSACNQPPVLSATSVCNIDGSVDFIITNNSKDTAANQSYTVTDSLNAVVKTGTITAAANGGTQTISVTNAFLNKPVTLTSNGGAQGSTTVISSTQSCNQPAVLSGVSTCTVAGSFFTITNNSQDTIAGQPYTVTNSSGTVVQSGTITAAANGGTQTIDLTGIFGTLNFSTTGTPASTTTVTISNNCQQPPVLAVSAVCMADGSAIFTITNSSQHTNANQTYTITDAKSKVVQTGTVTATANGGTQTITVPVAYKNTPMTLTSTGGALGATTILNLSQSCDEPPMLSGSAICTGDGAVFTIVNSSKDTDASQSYRVVDGGGSLVQSGKLNIPAGHSTVITVHQKSQLTLTTSSPTQGATTDLTIDVNCTEGGTGEIAMSLTPTPLPSEADAGIPVNIAGASCSRGCIDLQVYHTNRNGHWDIYRLVNDGKGQDTDVNLTDTDGKYDNMAPSRSPNAEWIVFTSNRDGNWELYLAPTDGNTSQTRRLTFNQTAIDTDPVWGPNNFVVFETNRNGNWDLHLLDMTTGKFYQLTTNTGNDVNPSWSNDGSKLVFQSDRSGRWQIYEMDMTTFQIRLLSDGSGDDMDPVYSEDNSRIAFRSDRGGVKSQLYVMGANGENPTAISDAAGYATNHSWSPDDNLIAYQSDLDGDLDVYVYDVASKQTRKLTDNTIPDYAPTWRCATNQVIFTSDVVGQPDIFEAKPLPISDPGIAVDTQADQLTQYPADNIYPEGSPVEENASREGRLPDLSGLLTGETVFLVPDVSIIPPDLSHDNGLAWEDIGDTCAPSTRDDLKQG